MLPRRALVSLHDQSHLEDHVRRLLALHVEVVTCQSNAAFLRQKGIEVQTIDALVGRAPGLPPRVEALDARIFAGILAAEDELAALATLGSGPIDLVAVDLPRLPQPSPSANDVSLDEVFAATELDRPALLRAAASNYARVIVVTDADDFGRVLKKLIDYQVVTLEVRRELAIRALAVLARYDATLGRTASSFDATGAPRPTPELFTLVATLATELRAEAFGGSRTATFYAEEHAPRGTLPTAIMYGSGDDALPTAGQIREAAKALELIAEWSMPAAALYARGRPVSVVVATSLGAAMARALSDAPAGLSSPLLVVNGQIDPASATMLAQLPAAKLRALVAPSLHVEALDVLQSKPGLSILASRELLSPTRAGFDLSRVPAGLVLETRDATAEGEVLHGRVVTQRAPTADELRALEFAWKVAKHAPSDAIVIARREDDGTLRTLGIGAGATSRRSAIDEALTLAGVAAAGCVLTSDGPIDELADLKAILDRGVLAIAHPGSINDVANVGGSSHVLAMIATGVSHLRV